MTAAIMPDPVRRALVSRLVVFQLSTGNILDIPSTRILATNLFSQEEERVAITTGGTRPRRRTTFVEARLIGTEEIALAQLIERIGCDCGMLAIGPRQTSGVYWESGVPISLINDTTPGSGYAVARLRLETNLFNPAVNVGPDLLGFVPWEGGESNVPFEGAAGGEGFEARALSVALDLSTATLYAGISNVFEGSFIFEFDITTDDDGTVVITKSGEQEYGGFGSLAPENLTFDADGNLWASGTASANADAFLTEHDGTDVTATELQELNVTTLGGLGICTGLSWDRPNNRLWYLEDGGTLYELDGSDIQSGTVTVLSSETPPGSDRVGFAIKTNTSNRYVGDQGSNRIIEFDDTGAEVASVDIPFLEPNGLDYTEGNATVPEGVFVCSLLEQAIAFVPFGGGSSDLLFGGAQNILPGYRGPLWTVPIGTKITASGGAESVTESNPAVIETIMPIPGASVQLLGVSGKIEALGWDGAVLSSSGAATTDPILDLLDTDLSAFEAELAGSTLPLWKLRFTVTDASRRPLVVVNQTGRALGPRPGGVVTNCDLRVASPEWSDVGQWTFDFEAENIGDVLDMRLLTPDAIAPNVVGVLYGDGGSDTGGDVFHTYESLGTYPVRVVGSPDLRGITELNLENSGITFGNMEFAGLPDLQIVRFGKGRGNPPEKQTRGSTDANTFAGCDDLREIDYFRGRNGNLRLQDLPDTLEILTVNSAPVSGDVSTTPLPAGLRNLNHRQAFGFTGTLTSDNIPSGIRVLDLRRGTLSVELSAFVNEATSIENVRVRNAISNSDGATMRDFMLACRNLREYRDRGAGLYNLSLTHSLFGTVSSGEATTYPNVSAGDPILPPSLETLRFNTASPLDEYPSDFSEAVNLETLYLEGRHVTSDPPGAPIAPVGVGYSQMIGALHTSRSVVVTPFELQINEPTRTGGFDPPDSTFDATDNTAHHQIIGLGTYHPDNGGEGLRDVGFTVSHGTLWTLTGDGDSASDSFFLSGDLTSFQVWNAGSGDDRIDTPRFRTGALFRVSGGANAGFYEISGYTYDSGNDRTELQINTSSTVTGAQTSVSDTTGETIEGFTNWDRNGPVSI